MKKDPLSTEIRLKNHEIKEKIPNYEIIKWDEKIDAELFSHRKNTGKYLATMKQPQNRRMSLDSNRTMNFIGRNMATDRQIADSFCNQ